MKSFRLISSLAILLLASCAGDGGSDSAPVAKESMNQRFSPGRDGYKQDSNGNWVASSEKRSTFESERESSPFKGEFAGKEYKKTDFSKKSWWGGNQQMDRKSYTGSTDGSRFQKDSKLGTQAARESGSASGMTGNYETSGYETGTASEASGTRLGKKSDAETDSRRRVFGQPEAVDWREQRPLSVDQTKSILGR